MKGEKRRGMREDREKGEGNEEILISFTFHNLDKQVKSVKPMDAPPLALIFMITEYQM